MTPSTFATPPEGHRTRWHPPGSGGSKFAIIEDQRRARAGQDIRCIGQSIVQRRTIDAQPLLGEAGDRIGPQFTESIIDKEAGGLAIDEVRRARTGGKIDAVGGERTRLHREIQHEIPVIEPVGDGRREAGQRDEDGAVDRLARAGRKLDPGLFQRRDEASMSLPRIITRIGPLSTRSATK